MGPSGRLFRSFLILFRPQCFSPFVFSFMLISFVCSRIYSLQSGDMYCTPAYATEDASTNYAYLLEVRPNYQVNRSDIVGGLDVVAYTSNTSAYIYIYNGAVGARTHTKSATFHSNRTRKRSANEAFEAQHPPGDHAAASWPLLFFLIRRGLLDCCNSNQSRTSACIIFDAFIM